MNQIYSSQSKFNKLYIGILVSLATIMVGFAVVTLLYEGAVSAGLIEDAIGEGFERLNRTNWLIAICCNIIGIQVFKKRKYTNIQRGIAIVTVLSAAVWFFYFMDSLLLTD